MLAPGFPLRTQRLDLRPFAESDLDAMYAIHSRVDVTRYLYWDPRTRAQVREKLIERARLTRLQREGDALVLAVVLRETGELVGEVNLHWASREHHQGEVGFILHPGHRGRGYATEAARPLLRLGFADLDLHRIIGRCDGRNAESARVMERLGMRREAHFHENEFVKGEWCDELVYAVLAREWEARPSI